VTPEAFAGIVAGLIMAATFREGAFYSADATLVLSVSLVVVIALLFTKPNRRSVTVVAALSALALWWLIRAVAQGRTGSFLPLGASMIAFAAAFLVTRRLGDKYRVLATQLVVAVGAVSSAAGLLATTARWYPLAMPAQNLWRLSTTLTYSNAAGALLAVALLVGLGLDPRAHLNKLMVCLCVAGLVATQSRGAVLGAIVGIALVPFAQLRRSALTLVLGILGGLAVVATSSGGESQPLATVAVVVAVVLAVALPRRVPSSPGTGSETVTMPAPSARTWAGARKRAVVLVVLAVATIGIAVGAGLVLRVPIERRVALGSSEDRGHEWTAALDQWRSSPVVGVGPDQLLYFHAADGNYAHFSHNEYLQVLADGGLVGAALLVLAGVCVVRAVRREDVATSCAAAALLAFAVVGALDFDWHLAALGLVGGWVAGLAARPDVVDPVAERQLSRGAR
jgi:O-antigen ligase